jgi:hypothetical protein
MFLSSFFFSLSDFLRLFLCFSTLKSTFSLRFFPLSHFFPLSKSSKMSSLSPLPFASLVPDI